MNSFTFAVDVKAVCHNAGLFHIRLHAGLHFLHRRHRQHDVFCVAELAQRAHESLVVDGGIITRKGHDGIGSFVLHTEQRRRTIGGNRTKHWQIGELQLFNKLGIRARRRRIGDWFHWVTSQLFGLVSTGMVCDDMPHAIKSRVEIYIKCPG